MGILGYGPYAHSWIILSKPSIVKSAGAQGEYQLVVSLRDVTELPMLLLRGWVAGRVGCIEDTHTYN